MARFQLRNWREITINIHMYISIVCNHGLYDSNLFEKSLICVNNQVLYIPSRIFCSNSSSVGSINSQPSGGGLRLRLIFGIVVLRLFRIVYELNSKKDWNFKSKTLSSCIEANAIIQRLYSFCRMFTETLTFVLSDAKYELFVSVPFWIIVFWKFWFDKFLILAAWII